MLTLAFEHPEAVPIGGNFSYQIDNGWYYYSNLDLVDFHLEQDRDALLLRLAKFVEAGVDPIAERPAQDVEVDAPFEDALGKSLNKKIRQHYALASRHVVRPRDEFRALPFRRVPDLRYVSCQRMLHTVSNQCQSYSLVGVRPQVPSARERSTTSSNRRPGASIRRPDLRAGQFGPDHENP